METIPDSEVLWGGPQGPGLVYIVEQLTKSVAELANSIADLTKVVSGNDGLQQQVTRLVQESKDRDDKIKLRIDHLWQVGTPLLVIILSGVIALVWRAAIVAEQHHV